MSEDSLERYGGVLAAPPRRRLRLPAVLGVIGALHALVIAAVLLYPGHHHTVACRALVPAGSPQQAWAVAFSPHGQVLVTVSGYGYAYLRDVATGRRIAAVSEPFIAQGTGPPAVSPDGTTLALIGDDQGTDLWDVSTGRRTGTLNDPGIGTTTDPINSGPESVAFSPNGRTLAVGDTFGEAYLWDVTSRNLIATLANPASAGGGTSVAFSPDGQVLAADDGNGHIYLWDVATRHRIATLASPAAGPSGPGSGAQGWVAFSPNGRTLAAGSASASAVYVWDAATWHQTATLPADGGVRSVAFSPNGRTLAAGTSDGNIDVWQVATWHQAATLTDVNSPGINSLAFSPDGRALASTDDGGNAYICPVG
jgi:WD40 repeat protein